MQVGVTEAARALGVGKSTVSRQVRGFVEKGLLAQDKDKKFDLDAYKRARAGELNPLKARNRPGELGYEASLGEGADEPTPPANGVRPVSALGAAATAEKAIGARLKQLELAKRLGKVVPRAQVEAAGADLAMALLDGLRTRNRRIAEVAASLDDPNAIEALLDREDAALLENIRAALAKRIAPTDAADEAA